MKNVGMIDRIVRLLIAAGAIALFFTGSRPNWEYGVLVVGLIFGVTALLGMCPLYRLIGVSTKKKAG